MTAFSAVLIFVLFLLAVVCLQAAALGWVIRAYRALLDGHYPKRYIIIPPGYKPELDIIPRQNINLVFLTREEYDRLECK